ncbi:hypothetical protein [uncultured Flavobacterium sp.]
MADDFGFTEISHLSKIFKRYVVRSLR